MYYRILDQIINKELDQGKRIAIYPFGEIGMLAKDILEKRYGQEAIVIDNKLKKYNSQILTIDEFVDLDASDITIILCAGNYALNTNLVRNIAALGLKASVANIRRLAETNANACEKKYCVLYRKAENCGLFSYFTIFLGGIHYCLENNLIPIIDMCTYDNIYQDGLHINSWELFFEQPCGYGLTEKENAEYMDCDIIRERPDICMDFLTNEKKINFWRQICKQYIRLKDNVKQYVEHRFDEYMPHGREKETIGVLCRGTDYTNLKPYGHPIQPSVREVIAKIKQFMKSYMCQYIFLATEDNDIYKSFYAEFGNRLIVPDTTRYVDTGENYLADIVRKEKNGFISGRNYLTSIYVLSKCKCLVAGRTSGSLAAVLLSEGYEDMYLWNLGYYGIDG